jgi:hypothetical protein
VFVLFSVHDRRIPHEMPDAPLACVWLRARGPRSARIDQGIPAGFSREIAV